MKPKPTIYRGLMLLSLLHALGACGSPCRGTELHTDGLDGDRTSFRFRASFADTRIERHDRNTKIFKAGGASEHVVFTSQRSGGVVTLEQTLPPARVIDDLKLSLWVRSNVPGATLAVRIFFPGERDPGGSGGVLSTLFLGQSYSEAHRWQRLECQTLKKQIDQELIRLRSRNQFNPNTAGMYVGSVALRFEAPAGTTELFLDELQFGPIVSPRNPGNIVQVEHREEPLVPVDFRGTRLQVEGSPFFPRVIPYHGAAPEVLREAGANVVWIPDMSDVALLEGLRREGIWAAATPPHAMSDSGELLGSTDASLMPFTADTSAILFWILGVWVPEQKHEALTSWIKQVETADRRSHRPVTADVVGMERVVSRQLGMLSVSRHVLGTTFGVRQYRDWLVQRTHMAKPGTFLWTWIQTESPQTHAARRAGRTPIVVEPEQLRLQLYAALGAGCRGVGYWSTTPLDADHPGALERRLALTQLNLELAVLEPLLATSVVRSAQIPVQVEFPQQQAAGQLNLGFGTSAPSAWERQAKLSARETLLKREGQQKSEISAAVLQSEYGALVLPVWYETDAQFCPGQMAAYNATVVVPAVTETARAFLITTTGLEELPKKQVTGGAQVVIPRFDQTAAVLFTSRPEIVQALNSKVAAVRAQSAGAYVELAQAKLERVRAVDQQLQALSRGQTDGPQLIGRAGELAAQAQRALDQGSYAQAREHAAACMQSLRILQRAHWDDAVRDLTAPVSSPHALCFQTLPEHWMLADQVRRSPTSQDGNLLPCGSFEEGIGAMLAAGWKHPPKTVDGVHAQADLYPDSHDRSYCLQLLAQPADPKSPPAVIGTSVVTVTTPPMPVRRGQVLQTSGWVRVAMPHERHLDGAMLFDNQTGRLGAIRWTGQFGWKRFEMLHEIVNDGDFTLTFALYGLGQMQIDDVRVVALELVPVEAAGHRQGTPLPPAPGASRPGLVPPKPLPSVPSFAPLPRGGD